MYTLIHYSICCNLKNEYTFRNISIVRKINNKSNKEEGDGLAYLLLACYIERDVSTNEVSIVECKWAKGSNRKGV